MTATTKSLLRRWDLFWYAPGSPRNLAAARIIFATVALWVALSRNWYGVPGLPAVLWGGVSTGLRLRYLDFYGHPSLEYVLYLLTIMSLFFALIGLWPRLSCFVSGLLLYHLAPLESIIWTPNPYVRGSTIAVIALFVLSFSRCGDAWALHKSSRSERGIVGEYTWPLRLIQVFLCQIYLFSGYAKLFHSGWHWGAATNMRNWLLYFSQEDQVSVFHTVGPWLAARPALCVTIGFGTLMFELVFIGVLFSRRLRLVFVPLAVCFHIGILLSMNLVFLTIPHLLVFANWDRVAGWFGSSDAPLRESQIIPLGAVSSRG